jgi:hypothetical protein
MLRQNNISHRIRESAQRRLPDMTDNDKHAAILQRRRRGSSKKLTHYYGTLLSYPPANIEASIPDDVYE